MICFVALIVFALMALFSVRYRPLAKEALDCVIRKTTFRKCNTNLDKRIKYQLTGRLITKNKALAKFVYGNFIILSYIFIILSIVSVVYTGIGGYNYVVYGNCNGPQDDSFCIFDPLGENNKVSENPYGTCGGTTGSIEDLSIENIDLSLFPSYNADIKNQVLFIGCYGCDYTHEVYPSIRKLFDENTINLIFAHYPVKHHTDFLTGYANCVFGQYPNKFIQFNDALFELGSKNLNEKNITEILTTLGIDVNMIKSCASSESMTTLNQQQFDELQKTGIYGTPTVFVNGKPIVGPKPYRAYKKMLD